MRSPRHAPVVGDSRPGRLTGTKFGCGMAFCGVCTVHVDGKPVRSCSYPVSAVAGRKVTTIEGVSGPVARAIQGAWTRNSVPQCGYCPVGSDHVGNCASRGKRSPLAGRHRDRNERQSVPLRTYKRIKAAIVEASLDLATGVKHG